MSTQGGLDVSELASLIDVVAALGRLDLFEELLQAIRNRLDGHLVPQAEELRRAVWQAVTDDGCRRLLTDGQRATLELSAEYHTQATILVGFREPN